MSTGHHPAEEGRDFFSYISYLSFEYCECAACSGFISLLTCLSFSVNQDPVEDRCHVLFTFAHFVSIQPIIRAEEMLFFF